MTFDTTVRKGMNVCQPNIQSETAIVKNEYYLSKIIKLRSNKNAYDHLLVALKIIESSLKLLNRYSEGDFIKMRELIT